MKLTQSERFKIAQEDKWTKEKPTQSGIYWMIPHPGDKPMICHVRMDDDGKDALVRFPGDYSVNFEFVGAWHWCGPIEPPEFLEFPHD